MEIWKNIEDFEGFQISNLGRIKRLEYKKWCVPNNSFSTMKEKILKTSFNNSKSYERIKISLNNRTKIYSIHRLVAITFIPNPNNYPQINHIDGDKSNNKVENLEWCTNNENMKHRYEVLKKFSFPKGESCNFSKLNKEKVIEISKLIKDGYKDKDIARMYNLKSTSTIIFIRQGITWKHLNLFPEKYKSTKY